MGKKKGGGGGRRNRGDSDGDDSVSTCSQSTFPTTTSDWDPEEGGTYTESDPFEAHIDALYEKRGSTREKALQGLVKLLTSSFCFDDCVLKQETLSSLFLGCLRRGGLSEATLAARALGLHLLTLASDSCSERALDEALPALQQVAKAGKSPALRAAAVDTLAICVFAVAEDPHTAVETMATLRNGFGSAAPPVAAAALRGWTLLLSTLPAWRLDSGFVEGHLKLLEDLLHSTNVEVRSAAGEAVALLYHSSGLAALANGGEDDEDDVDEEAGSSRDEEEEAAMQALAPGMDDVISRMRDLATNRGDAARRSKRDRTSLKGTFRQLCGAVGGDGAPTTKVKLPRGDVLLVDSFAGNTQLAALRRYLAEGFQVHLLSNPLLHQIFSFTPSAEPPEKLSAQEKRMYRSPGSVESKARAQQRKGQRAHSSRLKGTVLADNDDY